MALRRRSSIDSQLENSKEAKQGGLKRANSERGSDLKESFIRDIITSGYRKISTSSEHPEYASNSIRTSKYTLLTWAPKSLLLQFRRNANIYFLLISILTALPFSPKHPYSMAMTFSCILVFTMLKEAYEDYFRHRQDRLINKSATMKYVSSQREFVKTTWDQVRVGDLLKIQEDEFIPADLVCVKSPTPTGVFFLNTMNLDGETNLKEKLAVDSTKGTEDFSQFSCELCFEPPSSSLNSFSGCIRPNNVRWDMLGLTQLVLRGCQLKNTEYIVGIAVYTGQESKIMMNSKAAPSKVSQVLHKMNKMLYGLFGLQALLCCSLAGLHLAWNDSNAEAHTYLEMTDNQYSDNFFIQVIVYWVAYSHLIPISLYVTLEIVKLGIGYLVSQDLDMYYAAEDKPAQSRTSDLIEELGQVGFIFSDKTGTLTCNSMKLKKCAINEEVYGDAEDFSHSQQVRGLVESQHHETFFSVLSLCHTVFPLVKGTELEYHSTSPDELALVTSMRELGYKFLSRSQHSVTVEKLGKTECWEILEEIPFTSDRKRMSVIAQQAGSKDIWLFTKGADQVLIPLLQPGTYNLQTLVQQLTSFSQEGLRTLIVAQKRLDYYDFRAWRTRWRELSMRNTKTQEQDLELHAQLIENELQLLGVTAVEDKLQEGVGETIKALIEANIKFWVLTGDKQETAIEIAKSSNLIEPEMQVLNLSATSKDAFFDLLGTCIEEYGLETADISQIQTKQLAIVIDGVSLAWLFEEKPLAQQLFFKLGCIAKSCVCCRVSPSQKMKVVRLAKEFGSWVTLAIGDGANDVSMIQEAHIGVGVAGKEGTQAVQSADYALGRFKFLKKLLLVHGRWGYFRISTFIFYYFYKNMVAVFTELWFNFFNGFSGQIYFLDWLPMLYNSLWTSWPCLFTYIFEKDLNADIALENPRLFRVGQLGLHFSYARFCFWILSAATHGAVCFWMPLLAQHGKTNGQDTGLWWVSTVSFTLVIHVVTYKLYLEALNWNKINLSAGVFSLVLYYASVLVLNTTTFSRVFQPELNQLFYNVLETKIAWVLIVLIPLCIAAVEFVPKSYQRLFKSSAVFKVPTKARKKSAKVAPIKPTESQIPADVSATFYV